MLHNTAVMGSNSLPKPFKGHRRSSRIKQCCVHFSSSGLVWYANKWSDRREFVNHILWKAWLVYFSKDIPNVFCSTIKIFLIKSVSLLFVWTLVQLLSYLEVDNVHLISVSLSIWLFYTIRMNVYLISFEDPIQHFNITSVFHVQCIIYLCRLKESGAINTSLFMLSEVVEALNRQRVRVFNLSFL